MAASRLRVLMLYRLMLEEGQKFSSYNLRQYAARRIRHGFKENKDLEDPEKIAEAMKFAEETLQMMKRQVIIGKMYETSPLVIEEKLCRLRK